MELVCSHDLNKCRGVLPGPRCRSVSSTSILLTLPPKATILLSFPLTTASVQRSGSRWARFCEPSLISCCCKRLLCGDERHAHESFFASKGHWTMMFRMFLLHIAPPHDLQSVLPCEGRGMASSSLSPSLYNNSNYFCQLMCK